MPERIKVLPHHFEPVFSQGIWIVPCPDADIKVAITASEDIDFTQACFNGYGQFEHSNGLEKVGTFDQKTILVAAKGAEIGTVDNPIPSKSPESKAGYLIWKEIGVGQEKILVAVQLLWPFQLTSHHTHDQSEELFRKLYGKLYNYHNNQVKRVENLLRIKPGESHLSFTTNQAALTLLIQRGASIRHDYLNQPVFEHLRQQAEILDKR